MTTSDVQQLAKCPRCKQPWPHKAVLMQGYMYIHRLCTNCAFGTNPTVMAEWLAKAELFKIMQEVQSCESLQEVRDHVTFQRKRLEDTNQPR